MNHAAQIRRAQELLRQVLLAADAEDGAALANPVADRLNELVMELDTLGGQQELFERWVLGGKEPPCSEIFPREGLAKVAAK